jgi:hypothetical protein
MCETDPEGLTKERRSLKNGFFSQIHQIPPIVVQINNILLQAIVRERQK